MTPEELLRHFDTVAEAPSGVAKLRELILQLAVRGKLVPQDPRDEPASTLLTRIEASTGGLNGGPRRRSASAPAAANRIPFCVPHSWEWARLADVATIASRLVDPKAYAEEPHIAPDNIEKNTGRLLSYRTVREDGVRSNNHRFNKGQILYSKIRPNLSKLVVVDFDGLCSADMYPIDSRISTRYLANYMLSRVFVEMVTKADTRVAMPKVNQSELNRVFVPVPPLAEQHRIVAKIDELTALCDELEARQARRATARVATNASLLHHLTSARDSDLIDQWNRLRESFDLIYDAPETVRGFRQAIVELAVRGRLVAQDSEDEPANALLDRIVRQNPNGKRNASRPAPPSMRGYALPPSWTWVKLEEIASLRLGKMLDRTKNRGDLHPYLRNTNVQWMTFDLSDLKEMRFRPDESEEYSIRRGDLVVCEGGEPGRGAIWENRSTIMFQKALHRVRPYLGLSGWFILYCLRADALSGGLEAYFTGATIKHLTGQSLSRYVLPLPPMGEQHRIHARVTELMALCDSLEAQIGATREKSESLAASVVHRFTAA